MALPVKYCLVSISDVKNLILVNPYLVLDLNFCQDSTHAIKGF
jgi:hypothetical protein